MTVSPGSNRCGLLLHLRTGMEYLSKTSATCLRKAADQHQQEGSQDLSKGVISKMNRLSKLNQKYWQPVICETSQGDLVEGLMARDGLAYKFMLEDIETMLDQYPEGDGVWYFNDTKDREIAELHGSGEVSVNPQFVTKNFKQVVY